MHYQRIRLLLGSKEETKPAQSVKTKSERRLSGSVENWPVWWYFSSARCSHNIRPDLRLKNFVSALTCSAGISLWTLPLSLCVRKQGATNNGYSMNKCCLRADSARLPPLYQSGSWIRSKSLNKCAWRQSNSGTGPNTSSVCSSPLTQELHLLGILKFMYKMKKCEVHFILIKLIYWIKQRV